MKKTTSNYYILTAYVSIDTGADHIDEPYLNTTMHHSKEDAHRQITAILSSTPNSYIEQYTIHECVSHQTFGRK